MTPRMASRGEEGGKTYSTMNDLYKMIPSYVTECVENVMNGRPYLVNEEDFRKARSYFEKNSNILRILFNAPGSSRFTEIVYGIKEGEPENVLKSFMFGKGGGLTEIDEWCLDTLPCLGVKDRFSKVVSHLGEHAERVLEEKAEIVIGNFGSGLGRDTMEIAKNPEYGNMVKIDLIDTGERALATAKELAVHHGIGSRVRVVNESLDSLGGDFKDKYDIGLLIGILCPLKEGKCEYLLEQTSPTLKGGSLLIMSNASKIMGNGNPVSEFREKFIGWDLVYKNEKDLEKISKSSGFEAIEDFYDDYGQNVMLTVQK